MVPSLDQHGHWVGSVRFTPHDQCFAKSSSSSSHLKIHTGEKSCKCNQHYAHSTSNALQKSSPSYYHLKSKTPAQPSPKCETRILVSSVSEKLFGPCLLILFLNRETAILPSLVTQCNAIYKMCSKICLIEIFSPFPVLVYVPDTFALHLLSPSSSHWATTTTIILPMVMSMPQGGLVGIGLRAWFRYV